MSYSPYSMKRTRRSTYLLCLLALIPCLLWGCGGGGSGGSGGTTRLATPKLTIHWPARSRATNAFSAALSVLVRMKAADRNGQDISFTLPRTNNLDYTATYDGPTQAKVGMWRLEATFYGELNGSGSVVGTAGSLVTMDAQGNLPDIATQGTIAQVEILPGQSVLVGQPSDLAFRAFNANGDLIAVTPGSLHYTVSAGGDKARFANGYVEGIAPGTVTLIPSVDGITGLPQAVKVTSNASLTVTPNPITVAPGQNVNFEATVTNAPDTTVTWSVDEGSAGGTITANGVYTAPTTSGVYHVTARSAYDPEKWKSVVITVAGGGAEVGVDFPPTGDADVTID